MVRKKCPSNESLKKKIFRVFQLLTKDVRATNVCKLLSSRMLALTAVLTENAHQGDFRFYRNVPTVYLFKRFGYVCENKASGICYQTCRVLYSLNQTGGSVDPSFICILHTQKSVESSKTYIPTRF